MTSQNRPTAPFPTCCLTNGSALVATINVFKEQGREVLSFSLFTDLGLGGQSFVYPCQPEAYRVSTLCVR